MRQIVKHVGARGQEETYRFYVLPHTRKLILDERKENKTC